MQEAHDRLYIEESDSDRTIAIDSLGVGITEFNLSRERAMDLYQSGRAATEEFLGQGRAVSELTRKPVSLGSESRRRRRGVAPRLDGPGLRKR